ncbi:hypothetical protein THMIRHAS_13090 [Thiosulfatimonas sediminis]|uniref:Uncharacterized protein n=1 Tax=Thiosulfatimonas sediminis TaxID=2675054 RepID=A0A6F8PV16_9GAMM|nr:hypothetical protein [Thiosulfatimonas sediminis]BBP45936.1 hypothetical protein THMIRHAS_13090 [Thiosulfatimonas sediminis]
MFKSAIGLTIALTGLALWSLLQPTYAQTVAPKDAQFLGLPIVQMTLPQVRRQLWQIGGFKVSRSTRDLHHIDKFFTQSALLDSYNLTFYYNDLGQVTHFRRLYRPYSESSEQGQLLATNTLAKTLAKDFGAAKVERKGWGGFGSYMSYVWEDDALSIRIDRLNNHPLGDVYIEYRLKQNDPYAVQTVEENTLPRFVKGS